MASTIVGIIRLGLFGAVTTFSIIVLGASAHILSVTEFAFNTYWAFVAFAVAVSVLTILSLAALIVVSLIRTKAAPNYVIVELAWISVLWVLWLASAAYTSNQLGILPSGCSFNITFSKSFSSSETINCGEFWAMEAFAWLNWLILMPYTALLLGLTIIQQSRGNNVWSRSVHEVNFFAPREMQPGMVPQQQVYPPQQQVYQQPPPQQMPVQYTGTPPATYGGLPPQQQPMNTGYTQAPVNTGYAPAPATTGYTQDPASTGYTQAPATTGYTQAPPNPGYAQV